MGTGLTLWELRNHCVADNEALDLEMEEPAKPPTRCCSNSCLFTLAKEVPGDILDQNHLPEASCAEDDDDDELECRFCEPTNSCRFCFAGPERGELIAPCDCTGSQEFVHTKCLRQWQKVSMRTKGNRETNCRVCSAKYRVPARPLRSRVKLWFSFKARDRLNAYSRVWCQNLIHFLVAHNPKRLARVALDATSSHKPPDGLPNNPFARSSSATDLAMMLASTEVRIWAGREVRNGKPEVAAIRAVAWFGSVINIVTKLREMGVIKGK